MVLPIFRPYGSTNISSLQDEGIVADDTGSTDMSSLQDEGINIIVNFGNQPDTSIKNNDN